MLRRVCGMAHRLQVGDVLLPLLRVGTDGTECLECGRICRIPEIGAGSLCSDRPLTLRIELAIAGDLAGPWHAHLLCCERCAVAVRNGIDPAGGVAVGVCRW